MTIVVLTVTYLIIGFIIGLAIDVGLGMTASTPAYYLGMMFLWPVVALIIIIGLVVTLITEWHDLW